MIASVAIVFTRIAPTKKPSSRLKTVPQSEQQALMRNGDLAIDDLPHAGQRSVRIRQQASRMEGRFLGTAKTTYAEDKKSRKMY